MKNHIIACDVSFRKQISPRIGWDHYFLPLTFRRPCRPGQRSSKEFYYMGYLTKGITEYVQSRCGVNCNGQFELMVENDEKVIEI